MPIAPLFAETMMITSTYIFLSHLDLFGLSFYSTESEVEERKCDIDYNRLCVCREGFHRKGNKCGMEESTRGKEMVFVFN